VFWKTQVTIHEFFEYTDCPYLEKEPFLILNDSEYTIVEIEIKRHEDNYKERIKFINKMNKYVSSIRKDIESMVIEDKYPVSPDYNLLSKDCVLWDIMNKYFNTIELVNVPKPKKDIKSIFGYLSNVGNNEQLNKSGQLNDALELIEDLYDNYKEFVRSYFYSYGTDINELLNYVKQHKTVEHSIMITKDDRSDEYDLFADKYGLNEEELFKIFMNFFHNKEAKSAKYYELLHKEFSDEDLAKEYFMSLNKYPYNGFKLND
jgi:hypothetical protein